MQTPASQESQSLRFTKNPAACCLDGKTNFINSAHNKNDKHKVPCPFHIYILFLSSFVFNQLGAYLGTFWNVTQMVTQNWVS